MVVVDPIRSCALVLASALLASACGGGSDSAELEALREKVEALEAQTTTVAPPTTVAPTTTVADSQGGDQSVGGSVTYDEEVRNNFLLECQYASEASYCERVLVCIEQQLPQSEFEYEGNLLVLKGELSDRMADLMARCASSTTTAAPVSTTASCQFHACERDYDSAIRGTFLRECEWNGGTWSGCRKMLECIEYQMPQAKFEYEENFLLLTGELSDEMAHVMASCLTYG